MSGLRSLIKGYFQHCAGRRCGHVFGLSLPPSLVGLEACGSARHWARVDQAWA